ncbi:MAG: hypothetical protein AAFV62_08335, partial [Pseudomonadota bacterium]
MPSSAARLLALCALIAIGFTSPAAACGPETDCVIGDRTYRLSLPDGYDPSTAMRIEEGADGG